MISEIVNYHNHTLSKYVLDNNKILKLITFVESPYYHEDLDIRGSS